MYCDLTNKKYGDMNILQFVILQFITVVLINIHASPKHH
jgi:hypothetical protein